jgi:hypothetical protein
MGVWLVGPPGVIRQMWAPGQRLGSFLMTPTKAYWFITYNAPKAAADDEQTPQGIMQRWEGTRAGAGAHSFPSRHVGGPP